MRRVQSEIGGMLCRDSECAEGRALQCEIQRRTEIIPQSAASLALRKKEVLILPKVTALLLFLAHPPRFERGAFRLGGERSILLSYGCIRHTGIAKNIRPSL